MAAVTQQPLATAVNETNTPSVLHSSGPITIRNLQDTEKDAEFTGRIIVDTFEGKVVHCTSRQSLPAMRAFYARKQRERPPVYYERDFVAEYNGESVGSCVLRYHGDNDLFQDRDEDLNNMSCCDQCGLCCFTCATTEFEIPLGKGYIDHIGVDARFRGKGIGKVLLDMAEIDAKRKGCQSIYLWVSTSNRAQHLYERQGYVLMETGTLCCCGMWCLTGDREFARMEKILQS
ncbi:uncharacterized protein LOC125674541 isoform X2 [Ostrea edulis]|uniref:uncharacterized protein LOC125674541 isoform X2 n=1 Tax=Ostrea edulis TaxID=37623 RepID=UPI0024AFAABD|nr:uncharacterized protein LOC125674541 isoform X2 [Ostrea edulis]